MTNQSPAPSPLPVICDRCRAEGLAGEGDFAGLGDLLDFEPVPLQVNRVDGWTPECQRAFIAALSVLGSADRAARAVGKSATGAERLRRLAGAESFILAWERAKAISAEKGTLRLANSLRTAKVDKTPPPPEPPSQRDSDLEAGEEREKLEALEKLFEFYVRRLEMERIARLEGKVVEADFFVRQISVFEICMDLLVGDTAVLKRIKQLSVEGRSVYRVAETTMSRLLDEARRDKWAELAEPRRPPLLDRDQMIERDGYKLLRLEVFRVGIDGDDYAEWCAAKKAEYAAAARAQVEWEEQSRREAEEWRARHGEGQAANDDSPAGDDGAPPPPPAGEEPGAAPPPEETDEP